jgi:hypothetical protein
VHSTSDLSIPVPVPLSNPMSVPMPIPISMPMHVSVSVSVPGHGLQTFRPGIEEVLLSDTASSLNPSTLASASSQVPYKVTPIRPPSWVPPSSLRAQQAQMRSHEPLCASDAEGEGEGEGDGASLVPSSAGSVERAKVTPIRPFSWTGRALPASASASARNSNEDEDGDVDPEAEAEANLRPLSAGSTSAGSVASAASPYRDRVSPARPISWVSYRSQSRSPSPLSPHASGLYRDSAATRPVSWVSYRSQSRSPSPSPSSPLSSLSPSPPSHPHYSLPYRSSSPLSSSPVNAAAVMDRDSESFAAMSLSTGAATGSGSGNGNGTGKFVPVRPPARLGFLSGGGGGGAGSDTDSMMSASGPATSSLSGGNGPVRVVPRRPGAAGGVSSPSPSSSPPSAALNAKRMSQINGVGTRMQRSQLTASIGSIPSPSEDDTSPSPFPSSALGPAETGVPALLGSVATTTTRMFSSNEPTPRNSTLYRPEQGQARTEGTGNVYANPSGNLSVDWMPEDCVLSFLRSSGGDADGDGRNTPSPLLERRSSSRMGRRPPPPRSPRSPRSPSHARKQRSTAGSSPKDDKLGIFTRSRVPSFGSGSVSRTGASGGVRSRIFVSPMSSTASISPPSPRRRSPAFTTATGGRGSGIRPGYESPTPLSRNRQSDDDSDSLRPLGDDGSSSGNGPLFVSLRRPTSLRPRPTLGPQLAAVAAAQKAKGKVGGGGGVADSPSQYSPPPLPIPPVTASASLRPVSLGLKKTTAGAGVEGLGGGQGDGKETTTSTRHKKTASGISLGSIGLGGGAGRGLKLIPKKGSRDVLKDANAAAGDSGGTATATANTPANLGQALNPKKVASTERLKAVLSGTGTGSKPVPAPASGASGTISKAAIGGLMKKLPLSSAMMMGSAMGVTKGKENAESVGRARGGSMRKRGFVV